MLRAAPRAHAKLREGFIHVVGPDTIRSTVPDRGNANLGHINLT